MCAMQHHPKHSRTPCQGDAIPCIRVAKSIKKIGKSNKLSKEVKVGAMQYHPKRSRTPVKEMPCLRVAKCNGSCTFKKPLKKLQKVTNFLKEVQVGATQPHPKHLHTCFQGDTACNAMQEALCPLIAFFCKQQALAASDCTKLHTAERQKYAVLALDFLQCAITHWHCCCLV